MKYRFALVVSAAFGLLWAACQRPAPEAGKQGPVAAEMAKAVDPAKPANPDVGKKQATPVGPQTGKETALKTTAPLAQNRTRASVSEVAAIPEVDPKTYKDVELPPVTGANPTYPPFVGKRIGIVHTENVVGELEPCG